MASVWATTQSMTKVTSFGNPKFNKSKKTRTMKKIFYILASAIVALGAVACDNEGLDNIAPEANGDTVSFVATIDNTKTDLDENLATVWTAGDVIKVEWNGKTYHFTNSDDDVNTFSCTDEGLSAIKTAEIKATYSNNNDGAIDSEAGTEGALLTYEGAFSGIIFDVENAFLTITADKGATIALTASANIFSTGNSLKLTATGAEQYIAVNPETTTIALSIDDKAIKTSQENTLAVKKIYNLGNYYKQLDDIEKDKRYIFTKATEFTPGKWYAMVANNVAATAVTGNYDYLNTVSPIQVNENISLPASCAFGFTSTDGGYTIKQYDNRYLYMTGTYNSFNVTTSPTSGQVFSVEIDDEKATIVNIAMNKTVQYSTQYVSFGAYSTVTNVIPTLYELVEVDTNDYLLGVNPSSLSFSAEETTKQVISVATYGTPEWTAVCDADWVNVEFDNTTNEISVSVDANEDETNAREATITVSYGETKYEVTVSQAAKPAAGAVEGGRADFETVSSTNVNYVKSTTTAGWVATNCAVLKGGTSDSNPAFKMIGAETNRAFCMNGKTSATGTITSPTLTTGCGTLKFNYGLPFSDTTIKFQVDIIQNGSTVKTITINKTNASQKTMYSHEEVINVAGNFSIKFTNLSPSNSTKNKDRTAIWDVEWTGYAN